jgi:transcriptional regulator with XRE-family HTH domain
VWYNTYTEIVVEVPMEELKMIIAGNIGQLRREAGMTQLELAEYLNYTDKAVSKWERGESTPDIVTLKALADRFSVTVDYLLRADHPLESEVRQEYTKRQRRNHRIITVMSCVLVWLIAVFIHASVNAALPAEGRLWLVYLYAVPTTLVVLLVLNSIWGNRRNNFLIISALIWAFLACVYISVLLFVSYNMWLLFIVGIPAQIIVGLWSGLRYK